MLTKEKCSASVAFLYAMAQITVKHHNGKHKFTIANDFDLLTQLINEHFDNPPLKFEELKEGMWVWDVKNAEWVCIDRPIANVSYCKNLRGLVIFFEENRFYRKQVQEDV